LSPTSEDGRIAGVTHAARHHLPLYLIGTYTLLIVYASLYPLAGWEDRGIEPLAFLSGSWPRYVTGFDLVINTLAYVPLGLLLAALLRLRVGTWTACLLAAVAGCLLSLAMEVTQNFLPSRVPSNLDLACNFLGALLGGIFGARWGRRILSENNLGVWRRHVRGDTAGDDFGVLLLAAWLMTQFSPEILLFGSGDLRRMLDLPPVQTFAPERFANVEAGIAASGLLAAMLITGLLLRRQRRALTLCLVATALVVKTLAQALIAGPGLALAWLTAGSAAGIAAGLTLWLGASFLPTGLQRATAALALLLATVLVNAAPENPYLHNAAQLWQSGQFLNFNGLTRLICSLWPYLALPWLITFRPEPAHGTLH
jgi:VanZ family protein